MTVKQYNFPAHDLNCMGDIMWRMVILLPPGGGRDGNKGNTS